MPFPFLGGNTSFFNAGFNTPRLGTQNARALGQLGQLPNPTTLLTTANTDGATGLSFAEFQNVPNLLGIQPPAGLPTPTPEQQERLFALISGGDGVVDEADIQNAPPPPFMMGGLQGGFNGTGFGLGQAGQRPDVSGLLNTANTDGTAGLSFAEFQNVPSVLGIQPPAGLPTPTLEQQEQLFALISGGDGLVDEADIQNAPPPPLMMAGLQGGFQGGFSPLGFNTNALNSFSTIS